MNRNGKGCRGIYSADFPEAMDRVLAARPPTISSLSHARMLSVIEGASLLAAAAPGALHQTAIAE